MSSLHLKSKTTEEIEKMQCELCLNDVKHLNHLEVFQKEVCDSCFNKYKGDGINSCLFCGKPNPTDDPPIKDYLFF
jgi:hypothetical protein